MKNAQSYSEINTGCPVCISEAAKVDTELSRKVYEVLQKDCFVNSDKITVLVLGRTAYLEGKVSSEKERNIAYQDVVNVFGIRNVVNYLTFPCPYLVRNIA